MQQMKRVVMTAVVLGLSCQPPPGQAQPPKFRLEGSLGALMDLGYDEARLNLSQADVTLLFVRVVPLSSTADAGAGATGSLENYPVKVTYTFNADGGFFGAQTVDLAVEVAPGTQAGTISRDVQNDPRKILPKLRVGELKVNELLRRDGVVTGDFHGTFINGVEPASGHTVFGDFIAKVVVQ